MDTDPETISLETIKAMLDPTYELVYIDYNSSLDDKESLVKLQDAIQSQDWEPLDGITEDWLWDAQADSIDYIFKELAEEIESTFDVEDGEEYIEQYEEELKDVIYDRDRSTPIEDLLRNTQDPVFFYDTGAYIEDSTFDEELFTDNLTMIKDVLQITDSKYDKDLTLMLAQASYGGRLVIYYRTDARDMMKLGDAKTITFKNPLVAIIDTCNGSGDHTDLPGHTLTLALDPKNIWIDKTVKYSYVYEVCGMYSSFCDCTRVTLGKEPNASVVTPSTLHSEREVEDLYNKAYKAGGCTAGDMDMHRHRGTFYDNNFPCGTHCPHCGTFWID